MARSYMKHWLTWDHLELVDPVAAQGRASFLWSLFIMPGGRDWSGRVDVHQSFWLCMPWFHVSIWIFCRLFFASYWRFLETGVEAWHVWRLSSREVSCLVLSKYIRYINQAGGLKIGAWCSETLKDLGCCNNCQRVQPWLDLRKIDSILGDVSWKLGSWQSTSIISDDVCFVVVRCETRLSPNPCETQAFGFALEPPTMAEDLNWDRSGSLEVIRFRHRMHNWHFDRT